MKHEVSRRKTLAEELDEIDERTAQKAFAGYSGSRLVILLSMWDKGEAIGNYRGGKFTYYELEKETGRSHQSLIKWHKLYQKYPDRNDYLPIAEEKALDWARKVLAKEQKLLTGKADTPPLPRGIFDIIYADPPWEYRNAGFETSASQQYSTMLTVDICQLGIPKICADNAVLFLWVTNPLVPDGLEVMAAWGFEYKTNFCWRKSSHIAGFYCFGQHELLFLGVKGSMPLEGEKFGSSFEYPTRKHSQKPDEVYNIIEKMYPRDGIEVYLELFARQQHSNKWAVWGNEVNGTTDSDKT